MSIVITDYTSFYYTSVARTSPPPVITGKFVQIRNEITEYIVFSPGDFTKYHANIVERFCLDRGIEGRYDGEGKRYDIADRAWNVIGGGKFELDTRNRSIRLYDNSMAYGKFDSAGLKDKMNAVPMWPGFTVLIE